MSIATIEGYDLVVDLYTRHGIGKETRERIPYKAVYNHIMEATPDIYLQAFLHHIKATVKEGVYPIVTVFLPKDYADKLGFRGGVENYDVE